MLKNDRIILGGYIDIPGGVVVISESNNSGGRRSATTRSWSLEPTSSSAGGAARLSRPAARTSGTTSPTPRVPVVVQLTHGGLGGKSATKILESPFSAASTPNVAIEA